MIIITKASESRAAARSAPPAPSRARNHFPERIMPPPQRPLLRLRALAIPGNGALATIALDRARGYVLA